MATNMFLAKPLRAVMIGSDSEHLCSRSAVVLWCPNDIHYVMTSRHSDNFVVIIVAEIFG